MNENHIYNPATWRCGCAHSPAYITPERFAAHLEDEGIALPFTRGDVMELTWDLPQQTHPPVPAGTKVLVLNPDMYLAGTRQTMWWVRISGLDGAASIRLVWDREMRRVS